MSCQHCDRMARAIERQRQTIAKLRDRIAEQKKLNEDLRFKVFEAVQSCGVGEVRKHCGTCVSNVCDDCRDRLGDSACDACPCDTCGPGFTNWRAK